MKEQLKGAGTMSGEESLVATLYRHSRDEIVEALHMLGYDRVVLDSAWIGVEEARVRLQQQVPPIEALSVCPDCLGHGERDLWQDGPRAGVTCQTCGGEGRVP